MSRLSRLPRKTVSQRLLLREDADPDRPSRRQRRPGREVE